MNQSTGLSASLSSHSPGIHLKSSPINSFLLFITNIVVSNTSFPENIKENLLKHFSDKHHVNFSSDFPITFIDKEIHLSL